MIKLLLMIVFNAGALILIAHYVPWIRIEATWWQLAIIGIILAMVNKLFS